MKPLLSYLICGVVNAATLLLICRTERPIDSFDRKVALGLFVSGWFGTAVLILERAMALRDLIKGE